jgi:uncharacterized protein YndB with AHSA1/START domain
MTTKNYRLTKLPVVKVDMLIRKPVEQVFEAFVDPAVTTKFWFTKSSGKLKTDTEVKWEWEMYHLSADVKVKKVEKNSRIVIEWGDEKEGFTTVEWRFTSQPKGTMVSITESGFSGDGDEIVARAIDSTSGFTFVLAGAKAYLEHTIILTFVEDYSSENQETK